MYKALVSFGGKVSMRKGEVKAITDKEVIADLLNAGYIEEIKTEKAEQKAEKAETKTAKKPAKKVK